MTETNSNILHVTGSAELSRQLDFSKEYILTLKAEVDSIKKKNNDDGTFDFIHSCRLITCDLADEAGKKITTVDKRKRSQKMRYAIERLRIDYFPTEDDEAFYDRVMAALNGNLEEVLKYLKIIK